MTLEFSYSKRTHARLCQFVACVVHNCKVSSGDCFLTAKFYAVQVHSVVVVAVPEVGVAAAEEEGVGEAVADRGVKDEAESECVYVQQCSRQC